MVIEDFQAMHVPNRALSLIFSYPNEISLTLNYMNERSERKKLPGGFGAGTGLGGLCFIVKFNGACMRPIQKGDKQRKRQTDTQTHTQTDYSTTRSNRPSGPIR